MNAENKKDIHSGHRRRLKKKYLDSEGADFNDHELLELLLFYSVPRSNTNETAHYLVERFGSINRMAEASIDELKLVKGVGDNSAILLKMILSLAKVYANEERKAHKRIDTVQKAADLANHFVMGAIKELAFCIFTDNSDNLIDLSVVAVGTVNEVKPIIRNILELCVVKRATAMYFVHNHPNGSMSFSREDIVFTSLLKRELGIIGVRLEDHLVVDGHRFVSLKQTAKDNKCINEWYD